MRRTRQPSTEHTRAGCTNLEGQLEEAGGQGRLGEGGQDAAVAAHALAVGQGGVHLRVGKDVCRGERFQGSSKATRISA